MIEATVAIDIATAATMSIAPVHTADIHLPDGDLDLLAIAAFADWKAHIATVTTPGQATEATIEIAAIYQPPVERPANPHFSYDSSGRLTLIDYDRLERKRLTYANDRLAAIDYFDGRVTRRKSFNCDSSGALISVTETLI